MLIHPWMPAQEAASEWREWLAGTDRFGMLAITTSIPARHPYWCPPTSPWPVTTELLIHLGRPNPVSSRLEAGGTEVRLAVIGDYAYITRPTGEPGPADPDEDGVPTSYYASVWTSSSGPAQPLSTTQQVR